MSTTTTTTYNGWTNFATWRINLEICDDLVSSMIDDRQMFRDVDALATYLEEAVDDVLTNYGEITGGLALDYARAFVSDVNFREIADHNEDLIDIDEEEIEEDETDGIDD